MSQHHDAAKWSAVAGTWRTRLRSTLPADCGVCGQTVDDGMPWDVGHVIPISQGGTATADNLRVEHRTCNRRQGGRLGAAKTNAAAKGETPTETRHFKW